MSRLRSNKVVNQAGSGAPELTYGAVVPGTGTISGAGKVSIGGSITAGSFHGDGSGLSGVGDPSAIKDGSNVKVQAISTGANVTGNLAATGNVSGVNVSASGNVTAVDGTFSGNLTVQGTTTTIDTAVTSVDSLAIDGLLTTLGSVGIGTTNPATKLNVIGDARIEGFSNAKIQIKRTGNTVANGSIEFLGSDNSFGWGLIANNDAGGSNFNIKEGSVSRLYIKSGKIGINSTAPRTSLDIKSTDAVVVPVGTTGERPTPAAGMFRYNTTEGKFEGYTTEWGEIGGGGGGITTEAHVANNAVVTLDLTAAVDHKVTATGICTITCTGGTEAQSHTIRIINSGSATVGFSTYFLFPSGNTPVLPSTDGAINLISFTVNRVGAAGTQLLAGASLNFS